MKKIQRYILPLAICLPLGLLFSATPEKQADAPACTALLNHQLPSIDGETQNLCQYQGKVILAVNTASFCGYTPQYKDLQSLYSQYKDKGLVVLGFPANNFGKQEPHSNKKIKEFCSETYKVSFPLFAKSPVLGDQANPFYKGLIKTTGQQPLWNFHKYLIDRSGKKVLSYESSVTPSDPKFKLALERFLQK